MNVGIDRAAQPGGAGLCVLQDLSLIPIESGPFERRCQVILASTSKSVFEED